MAKGTSGRLVIEIEPALKEQLYQALGDDGLNLKQWFLENVSDYLRQRKQPELPFMTVDTYARGPKA
jgi:hypothetical protein